MCRLLTTFLIAAGTACILVPQAFGQTSVTTQHNDIARTGANTNETILTPSNVNANTFGKLFSVPVDGWIYAQPLYMPGVTMGAGTAQPNTAHNVVFVATEHDSVFAFDADSNAGANANPLWQVSLIDTAHGGTSGETTVPAEDLSETDIVPEIGITSTPVIDPTSNTIYVTAKSTIGGTTFIWRLHALDITTGQEKFGGPVTLSGSVAGTGNGSSGGTLKFDPMWQNNRAGLLLVNGIVYIGFGSHADNGTWHGWILAYNAKTLQQTGVWCTTPNATGAGVWMGGTGLAADVPSGKPYGRIFAATGNGTFDAVAPNYTNSMDYGDSIIKLDLTNGVPTMVSGSTTVGDDFTPNDQNSLNNNDEDQGSGGVVVLPSSVGGGGDQLVQVGKPGIIYVLNRENLGGYNPNNTTDPGTSAYVNGLWGAPAYWNGNIYVWTINDSLMSFGFANGAFTSSSPSSTGAQQVAMYSPTPSISANGATNGIVWALETDNYGWQGPATLYAYDASNVANLLYSSATNAARDNPGNSVKFVVPTIVNGKVYVGTESQLSVYGLLNGATQAATPVFNPGSESFSQSLQVTITDATPGVTIYYTTDGSTPTTASTPYTGPFNVTNTTTVNAIAAGSGYLASADASATYTLISQAAAPTFSPLPGYYGSAQSVTVSTTTPDCSIYYTLDGSTPTTASTLYTGPISVSVTETISAIAVDNTGKLSNSPVTSGAYNIDPDGVTSINFGNGFSGSSMVLLGNAKLNGSALELTDGGANEAAAAWFQVQANIVSFSTEFKFQITPASASIADGFTFTIQANNTTSLGPGGGGLGYGPATTGGTPGIGGSVAVKFDLYNNAGEGTDSTGLYTNGASPTVPAVDMTSSGINLHSGDVFDAHLTYNGTTLTLILRDTVTNAIFATSWTVNIPNIIGGNAAYVGFTGGTGSGGLSSTQQVLSWTFASALTPFSVQTAASASSSSASSLSVALPGETSAGDVILVAFDYDTTTTPSSVADSQGNKFTAIGNQLQSPGGSRSRVYYAKNIAGGADTVTVTLSGKSSYLEVYVSEYSATDPANPVDAQAGADGGAGSVSSGNANTTSANDLIYGYCAADYACTAGSGFTARSTFNDNLIEDKQVSTASSYAATGSANSGWTMQMVALKPPSPGISEPPAITSAATASGTVGSAFSYQITATNSPTSFTATSLPAGLSVNTSTGLISGTPSAAGTSSVTLSATNSAGTGTATLTLTISSTVPVITSATSASGTVGTAFSYQITATNSPTSYGATGLPSGLSVNTSTGLISGTPTAAGTSSVTLSATNSSGTGTATLTLTISSGAPVITSAKTASGTVGTAFSYQITATNSPTSYGATGLPSGLSVNASTGLISGTPTAAGTSSVTLSATNSSGTGTATLTLTIGAAAAIASVQTVAKASSGAATSLSIAFPSATKAGDLLLVAFDYATTATPSSVTDSQGNVFTAIGNQLTSPGGSYSRVYYAKNIKGGADTVTVSLTASSAFLEVYLSEYSGADQNNPIDAQAGAAGSAGAVSSGNIKTTVAGDVIYGYCAADWACTAGSGFTTRSSFNDNLIEDKQASSIGTYAATGSATNGWTMQVVAIKP